MQDDLNILVNGRRPQKKKKKKKKKMNSPKNDPYAILKNITAQLLPGNLTNTT